MAYSTLLFEQDAAIATIRMNRPAELNPINLETAAELSHAMASCAHDGRIRVVVLTGSGRAFCAGGDVGYMRSLLDDPNRSVKLVELIQGLHHCVKIMRTMPKPIIAAVNGVAAGAGCNLALACDYRLAVETARFNQAFVRLGLCPDTGGSYFLPRMLGMARATELLMTGDFLDAREALALGLLNQVVSPADFDAATRKAAERFAGAPTAAVGGIKNLINRSLGISLEEQLDAECAVQGELAKSADFEEGLRAFFEKRPPVFKGA
ncbi:MAG: enoyl-CoA hydratase/isomerase family protein [Candidatus Tectomicrobia bacterium]|nr:enoyl-CoA hydratase/isomerase family protein [Candidatus Tectomicrobia bacterium]